MSEHPCIVCGNDRDTQPLTCIGCLARTRSALLEIVELYALLPATIESHAGASGSVAGDTAGAETPMVGGDAMVLLGPGSDGANQIRDLLAGRNGDYLHGEFIGGIHQIDELAADPLSVLGELERWERDWRHTLGLLNPPTAATVADCAGFLTTHLTRMAQNPDTAFDEFATDMRRLLALLHHATRTGEHIQYGVPCLDCGTQLVRRARKPRPCNHAAGRHAVDCDQGGLGDWRCSNPECPRVRYTEADYLLALAEHWRKHELDLDAC